MIDYKKYINALRKCAKEHENDRTSTGHVIVSDLCRDTANLLEELEQESRWISVSERLPEKNMRCLVAIGQFNFTEIATYSDLMGIIDHKIFYQGDVGHDNFKNITQYVKAWMPLPKPYSEVEE